MKVWFLALSCGTLLAFSGRADVYEANWESLNRHPCPQWWQDAKFGIFIHWGVYSVPAYADPEAKTPWWRYAEQYWTLMGRDPAVKAYHERHYHGKSYKDLAPLFTAGDFDAAKWADLFRRSGARYVVLTSRHHDGFALWPSKFSPGWNAGEVGPHRDLCGELATAVRAAGLKMGFYFSHLIWKNELYSRDPERFVREVNLPQLKELVCRCRPDIVWGDGEWDHPAEVWHSAEFLQWLYDQSPVRDSVVVNDRWGKGLRSKCGDFYSTEYSEVHGISSEGFVRPFEECRGIGSSFGYNRFETTSHYHDDRACIEELVEKVSRGGNLLLNIGPDANGLIPAIMEERLLSIGKWLSVNGEAIYGSRKGTLRTEGGHVYSIDGKAARYVVDFRLDGKPLLIRNAGKVAAVSLLGSSVSVPFVQEADVLKIRPPALPPSAAPCAHAWVYRVSSVPDGIARSGKGVNADSSVSILDYGARVSDVLQTKEIQSAIDAVAARGGGVVRVPEGNFRTGGLVLKSGVTLCLENGAHLEASRNPEDYPNLGSRWYRGIIRADGARDIAIVAEGSATINGMNCYDAFGEENYRGPHGILLLNCTNVVLRGYTVRDSANWAHAMFHCGNVRLSDVKVFGGHDAVDFHDSDDVVVERCELRTGDDAIAGFGNYRCAVRDCILDSSCNVIRYGGTACLFERCRSEGHPSFGHRYRLTEEERRLSVNNGRPGPRSAGSGFSYYCDMRWTIRHTPGDIVIRDCTFDRPGRFLSMGYDGRDMWCCNRPLVSIAYENCDFLSLDRGARVYGSEDEPIAVTFRNCRFSASPKGRELPVGSFYNFSKLVFEDCRFDGYAHATVETRSEGEVRITGGTPLEHVFRPDPADKVLTFSEIAAALQEVPSDPAAFEAWLAARPNPPAERWSDEHAFYMRSDDPALHDIWGSVIAVWRDDPKARLVSRTMWSMCRYFTGWDRLCAVFDKSGGVRAQEAVGPYAYGLSLENPYNARVYLTDFVRLPVKSPAAVAGVKLMLNRKR